MSNGRPDPSAGFCPRCGALNAADFDRCIRCGAAISPLAASADLVRSHADGQSLLATKAIAGLSLLVFALQVAAWIPRARSGTARVSPLEDFLLFHSSPAEELFRMGTLVVNPGVLAREPWRLLSAVFVHYGALHFAMNMLGFANMARIAERLVGSARLIITYVITGIAGFATTALFMLSRGAPYHTAGASGAIFGVMGLVLGCLLRRRDPAWKSFAVQAVFYSLLFGFALNSSQAGIGVNNSAHLGGLASGILFGLIYGGVRRKKSDLLVNVTAVTSAVACVIALILPHFSPLLPRDGRDGRRSEGTALPAERSGHGAPGERGAATEPPG